MKRSALVAAIILLAGCSSPSAKLTGQPSWFPLGPEVYQERDHVKAQQCVLKFRPESRWFGHWGKPATKAEYEAWKKEQDAREREAGMLSVEEVLKDQRGASFAIPTPLPYPRKLDDVPLVDRGASLRLEVCPTDNAQVLRFTLTLSAGDRALEREMEHRWTNALPFLFAFYADGKAVHRELGAWGREGGAAAMYPLVDAGGGKTYALRVDTRSIDALLADAVSSLRPSGEGREREHIEEVRTLDIVVSFAERQHEGHFDDDRIRRLNVMFRPDDTGPPILIRSQPVRLERRDGRWVP